MSFWDVAALFGGNHFRHYRLHFNAEIADALQSTGRDFWTKNVLGDVQPDIDGSKAVAEYLKQRFTTHTELVREAVGEEASWIGRLCEVKDEIADLEELESVFVNILKNAIGDSAGITSRSGKVTWKAPRPSEIVDWKSVAYAVAADFAAKVPGPPVAPSDLMRPHISAHTTQKENSRRFLLTVPKEEK